MGGEIPGQSNFSSRGRPPLIHCQTLWETRAGDNGEGWGAREEEVVGGSGMSARMWGRRVCGRGLLAFPREPERRNRKNRPSPPGSPHGPSLEAAPHPAALTCKGFWGRVELALRQSAGEEQRSTGNRSLGSKIPCTRRHRQPSSQTEGPPLQAPPRAQTDQGKQRPSVGAERTSSEPSPPRP